MSTTLLFCVKGQRITRADAIVTVADAINYIYAEFAFCSDWDGLVKTAVFTRGSSSYEQILEDDKCLVPYEILEDGPGIFKVSVFAGNLITTAPVKVRIDASGWSFALESSQPPTPSVYQQIIDRMTDIETDMETATAAAEASAVLAESYAKGGTSTRQGEDTDNARYYSEQASGSAEEAAQIVQDFDDDVVAGAIAAVEAAGTEQIGAVNSAGATQVGAVENAGSAQTTAVNNAGSTQVGLVQAKGMEQVAAVQAKGTEVIGSIPQDYSGLSDDVSDLKSALEEVTGVQRLAFENGYIDVPAVGSTGTITRTAFADRKSATAEVSEGKIISINVIGVGTSSAGGRAWAFLDEDYTVISRAVSNLTIEDALIAPADAKYVVINTRTDTITDYYAYIGALDQNDTLIEADTNAKAAVSQLGAISGKIAFDLSSLEVKQFWVDIPNSIVDTSIDVPARLVVVPVDVGQSIYVHIPLISTKRVAFCNAVVDGSLAYDAQEFTGSLDSVFKNTDYKYFVIQLFINSDSDKDYTHYFVGAEIASLTALDIVARSEIDDIWENGAGGIYIVENLKGLPILDAFGDITIDTSAYDDCAAFHALVKEDLCDNSNGYVVQTLLGNDGHDNNLYKYVTYPETLKFGANRKFGTPSYPIAGGSALPLYTVIITSNIHGVEHGGNWVVYNMLKKMQEPDTDMLRFFKRNVKLIWVPYICASGNYENADGININRDFPIIKTGMCTSAEGTLVKAVLDEYGPTANLHIDIHTFDTTGTYAQYFSTWTFTDSAKLGKRSVNVSKSVVDRYAEKYPDINVLKRDVVSAVNTETTCTYYTQKVYGVPSGTIEGALSMGGSPEGADTHTSATAYLYDIITQVICAMAQ